MTRPTILDLDLVVVPREADVGMLGAWYRYKNGHRFAGEEPARDTSDVGAYSAMLSASPYPTAWDDVRKYVEGLERSLATCEADRVDRIEQCDRMANDWADFCASVGVTWDTHESVACEIEARAEARIAELEKEKHAALTMIAMLEKRLSKADAVVKPFAKLGEAMRDSDKTSDRIAWGYNEADLTFGDFRAARAYMEGK